MAFFRDILRDPQFAAGEIHTGFIAEYLARRQAVPAGPDSELAHILAAIADSRKTKTAATSVAAESGSEWLREGRSRLLR